MFGHEERNGRTSRGIWKEARDAEIFELRESVETPLAPDASTHYSGAPTVWPRTSQRTSSETTESEARMKLILVLLAFLLLTAPANADIMTSLGR